MALGTLLQHGWTSWAAFLIVASIVAELAFYALYWRPRRSAWNAQPPAAARAPSALDASAVFARFAAAGESGQGSANLDAYLSLWFGGVPVPSIRRGNMEELMAYGFWYKTPAEMAAAGLGHVPGEMVDTLERIWSHEFPQGYTPGLKFMSHLWEDIKAQYRPLAFYCVMEAAALLTAGAMATMGFRRRRMGAITYYTRGLGRSSSAAAASGCSTPSSSTGSCSSASSASSSAGNGGSEAAAEVEAQTEAAPILFLHGVGGMVIYLDLIWRIAALGAPVIAVDVRHVGMRLSPASLPCVDEMTSAILAVLDAEGTSKVCVVGHSYGTLLASRLVKRFPSRLHSLVLVDPVCFTMYMPHLLHNFFYRRLKVDWRRPLSFLLDLIIHFASRDLHLATAFSRRFFWSDCIMWPDELPAGSVVVLGAADDLVHADEVHEMLTATRGGSVECIYNPGLFHGAFLVMPSARARVVAAVARVARGRACDSRALHRAAASVCAAEAAALEAAREGGAEADEAPDGASETGQAAAATGATQAEAAVAAAAAEDRASDQLGPRVDAGVIIGGGGAAAAAAACALAAAGSPGTRVRRASSLWSDGGASSCSGGSCSSGGDAVGAWQPLRSGAWQSDVVACGQGSWCAPALAVPEALEPLQLERGCFSATATAGAALALRKFSSASLAGGAAAGAWGAATTAAGLPQPLSGQLLRARTSHGPVRRAAASEPGGCGSAARAASGGAAVNAALVRELRLMLRAASAQPYGFGGRDERRGAGGASAIGHLVAEVTAS